MRSFYNVLSRTVLTALPLVVLFVVAAHAFGDGGSIPFEPGAYVFEPNQRAMIAWNGEEEILLLSTDLGANRPTKVLEVFPFPSEPKVTEGDIKVFHKANEVVATYLEANHGYEWYGGGEMDAGGDSEPAPSPPARVTFQETIGAHDVATIQVVRMEGFIEWVEEFLRSQNVANPVIPPVLKQSVEDYIEDGFTWFVFDVVSLTKEPQAKQAIQFQFKTNCLYYPLRISRAEHGETTIQLLVLTTELLNLKQSMQYGIAFERLHLMHSPVEITGAVANDISPEIYEMLDKPDHAVLRTWEIYGELSEFEHDLVVTSPAWSLQRGRGSEREEDPTALLRPIQQYPEIFALSFLGLLLVLAAMMLRKVVRKAVPSKPEA